MPAFAPDLYPVTSRLRHGAAIGLVFLLSACGSLEVGRVQDAARDAARDATRAASSLFGATGPETRPLSVPLAPATRPPSPLPRQISARDPRSGAALRLVPVGLPGDAVEVRQSDGCVWQRGDWFAPSSMWRDCDDSRNWHTGRATVSGGAGLWPLRVGAQTRFDRSAVSHTGRRLERTTTCRVRDAVEVLRAGRSPTPAFVVDCADGKRVRTTWWAPDEGPIAFRKRHAENGIEEFWIAR